MSSRVVAREEQNGTPVLSYELSDVTEHDIIEQRLHIPRTDEGRRLSAIEQEAYRRGYLAGEATGRAEGLRSLKEVEEVLLSIITEIKHLRESVLTAAEREILAIALATAKRVLRHEMAQSSEGVLGYIREAIAKVAPTQTVAIRVPPQDVERLTRERTQLVQLAEGVTWLKIESDPHLQPGECLVEGQERTVDARLDAQISAIEKGLKLRRHSTEDRRQLAS